MGRDTAIPWAHHTFNPWIGCTKVAPECDGCYAEALMAQRYGRVEWGPGKPRVRTGYQNWRNPIKWNREARELGIRYRVFCASLADVFDNEVEQAWREDLWELINDTPHLDWLLLTKRIGNAKDMLPFEWVYRSLPPWVWLGITTGTQAALDRDVPKLLALPAHVRWLSVEPMLQRIDLCEQLGMWWNQTMDCWEGTGERINSRGRDGSSGLDWVVCGGESNQLAHRARPLEERWCLDLLAMCRGARVPFFMKQGSQANWPRFKDFEAFPPALRVREFPV